MAALDFPANPTNGQAYTSGSTTWAFNTTYGVWRIVSSTLVGYAGSLGYTGSGIAGFTGSTGIAEDEFARTIALLGL